MRPIFTIFLALAFQISISQIPNNGFRNWTYLTDSFGFSTYIPSDTFSYLGLNNWTSSNQLTGNPASGGKYLSNQFFDNTLSKPVVRLNTDSIYLSGSLNRGMIAPGFIINGNFRFNLAQIIFTDGGIVNPGVLGGAGSPVSQRYDSIGIWAKYTPIPGDSLLIWAVLKSKGNVVASAKTYSTQASGSYSLVGGKFIYTSCDMPDTVVVMIASSNPNFSTLLSGASGLEPGSVLLVDSVILTNGGAPLSPIVNSYNIYMFENQVKKVNILSGDSDCAGNALTASLAGQPSNGSASLIDNDTLVYTPHTGFTGVDTIFFSVSNGNSSVPGTVRVSIFSSSGISNPQLPSFYIYPNPLQNSLQIHFSDLISGQVQIFDLTGRRLIGKEMEGKDLNLDISGLSAGSYLVNISNANGSSTLKFVKE